MDIKAFATNIVDGKFDHMINRFSAREDWVNTCYAKLVGQAHASILVVLSDQGKVVGGQLLEQFMDDSSFTPYDKIKTDETELLERFINKMKTTIPDEIPALHNCAFSAHENDIRKPTTQFIHNSSNSIVDVLSVYTHANGKFRTLSQPELVLGARINEWSGDRNKRD